MLHSPPFHPGASKLYFSHIGNHALQFDIFVILFPFPITFLIFFVSPSPFSGNGRDDTPCRAARKRSAERVYLIATSGRGPRWIT